MQPATKQDLPPTGGPYGWTVEYERSRRLVSCTCGYRHLTVDDVDGERLLDLHDAAHRVLARRGVS